ncbi:hypothetical protein [Peterkaempfera bronchialis]|uniref:hypothetical protein n=1 Tax=Peterkaempfera bronchialis TaxID=2126346 RepID=UPI003C2C5662
MESDQVTVLFTENTDTVNAYVYGPLTPRSGADDMSWRYPHIIGPLEHRGLQCVVDFGLSDYIVHVLLPDGSHLTISPPQETGNADGSIPGFPDSWMVTRDHPDSPDLFEVVYDSEPGGPHERNKGSAPAMLAAVYARLEQLGVPGRERLLAAQARAEAVLREAGFVALPSDRDIPFRLPAGKTGLAERSAAVTRAVHYLKAEGFGCACPADLLDSVAQAAPPAVPARTRGAAARATSPTVPLTGGQPAPVPDPMTMASLGPANQRRLSARTAGS